jgi:hypothetical protein
MTKSAPRWTLRNPDEIGFWIQNSNPDDELITEVLALVVEILEKAPNFGLRVPVLMSVPSYHALTSSGRASISWSVIGRAYAPADQGVYIKDISSAIIPPTDSEPTG